MVLKGRGRAHEPVKRRIVIYIPASVHNDSAFPFKPKEKVDVEIVGRELVIKKIK